MKSIFALMDFFPSLSATSGALADSDDVSVQHAWVRGAPKAPLSVSLNMRRDIWTTTRSRLQAEGVSRPRRNQAIPSSDHRYLGLALPS